MFPDSFPTGLPDGLPDADRDDYARAVGQAAHVSVGLGHQRLLFGDRRRQRADTGDLVWTLRRPDLRGRRLPSGPASVLRGASAIESARARQPRASNVMIKSFKPMTALVT